MEADVNGIFSATPAPGPIRLLIGSQGLVLVQTCIAWQLPAVPAVVRILGAVLAVIAIVALISAAIGEGRENRAPYWRRRRDR
ncbi:hypothetical protein HHL08_21810 [Sphingobium sp. AR-3-1]|uniref:Uncharacterized protein n=1 Tax=Sphingobium psychrophilum TaxID=2728834 RepID=A0A7X9WZE0_9SPHN|nr:hypothetical protein [Sphingobium psychrophilum]